MLPPTYPTSKRPKYRPITAADSAATTGLVSNPNGTYISNPHPTTAQNGALGAYGAMLPSVQVQSPLQANKGYAGDPVSSFFKNKFVPFMQNANTSLFGAPEKQPFTRGPGGVLPNVPKPETYQPNNLAGGRGTTNPSQNRDTNVPTSAGSFSQEAAMQGVLSRIEMGDMTAISQVPKADLEAMGLGEFAAAGGGGGSGNTDFQKTAAYQYNMQNNVPFLNQKRWDPQKNKLITVGQYLKQEKAKYNKHGKKKGGRGGGGGGEAPVEEAAAAPTPTGPQYTVQQFGVVNFNTATG